jgi:hypothetical protein
MISIWNTLVLIVDATPATITFKVDSSAASEAPPPHDRDKREEMADERRKTL